jgi:hypothetical protein
LRQVLLLYGNDRVYELAASKIFDNTTWSYLSVDVTGVPARLSVSLSPHLSMCELGCVADTQSMVLGIAVAEHDEDGPHSKLLYTAMMLMADFPLPLTQ